MAARTATRTGVQLPSPPVPKAFGAVAPKPWRRRTPCYLRNTTSRLSDEDRARELEQYLKSASGRAFEKKHPWVGFYFLFCALRGLISGRALVVN
jgi:hypothetical protein